MTEHPNAITIHGNPLTLIGDLPKTDQLAPDCELLANDLSAVKLSDQQGSVCVICTVPSLDTPVCDTEIRKFNEETTKLGSDVKVLAVSTDLPFAQARWCGAAGIENVQTLSDHRDVVFGEAFGVLIKELRLLARAIFVLDKQGILKYIQLVDEVTSEPDYEAALNAVKSLV